MADRKDISDFTAEDVEDIIRKNYDDVYKYCYFKVHSRSDAEDLTQETFLKFVQALSGYTEQGKPKALLYTIARNLCINWYKRAKAFPLTEVEKISSGDSASEQVENKIVLEQCIRELPPEQQEVIELRFGQELKVNEIASVMGISRFSVMYRIRSALKELSQKLGKGGNVF